MTSVARDEHRYACSVAVRVTCPTWQNYLELYATNISSSGVFVASDLLAKLGTIVGVELILPTGASIMLRAEVMHHKEDMTGMGLRFLPPIDDKTRSALDSMVSVAKFTQQYSTNVMSTAPSGKVKAKPADPALRQHGPRARTPKAGDGVEKTMQEELARRLSLSGRAQLGVDENASEKEINRAFMKLTEQFHPIIFERYPDATRDQVRQLNQLLHDAYVELTRR